MRFAGTWKQYSAKAMSQLITMTLNSGAWRYFRWPYQAKVMKMLERVRSRIVVMRICCLIPAFDCTLRFGGATGASAADGRDFVPRHRNRRRQIPANPNFPLHRAAENRDDRRPAHHAHGPVTAPLARGDRAESLACLFMPQLPC